MKALTSREIRHKLELMVLIIFLTRVISMMPQFLNSGWQQTQMMH
mgnify:CR=1 FL=1